jgi:hypothetical protein
MVKPQVADLQSLVKRQQFALKRVDGLVWGTGDKIGGLLSLDSETQRNVLGVLHSSNYVIIRVKSLKIL